MNNQRQTSHARQGERCHSNAKLCLDGTFGDYYLYKPSNYFRVGTNNIGTLAKTSDDNDVKNQKLRHLIEAFQLDAALLQEFK